MGTRETARQPLSVGKKHASVNTGPARGASARRHGLEDSTPASVAPAKLSLSQGVAEPELGEAREVAVRGAQGGPVFQGQRGQVRVHEQRSPSAAGQG